MARTRTIPTHRYLTAPCDIPLPYSNYVGRYHAGQALPRHVFETAGGVKDLLRAIPSSDEAGFLNDLKEGMITDVTEYLLEMPLLAKEEEGVRGLIRQAITDPYFGDKHYRVHRIRKKSGGMRIIEAPSDLLKKIQRSLLTGFFYRIIGPNYASTGFRRRVGVVDNAARHFEQSQATQQVVLKMDLQDFFPSIPLSMVFRGIQYRFKNRSLEIVRRVILGTGWRHECLDDLQQSMEGTWVSSGSLRLAYIRFMRMVLGMLYLCVLDDRLPQGAPTSPHLANMAMAKHDAALGSMSDNLNMRTYTRYADDMTISTAYQNSPVNTMKTLMESYFRGVPYVKLNPKKTAILRHGKPQRITGLNINHKVSVSRWKRDNVRAEIHNLLTGKTQLEDGQMQRLSGYRAFMRNADQAGWDSRVEPLWQRLLAAQLG